MRLLRNGAHFYLVGLIILTFGIALSIQSTLGTSPFDALLVGLYRTFGLSIGSWEIVVGLAMVIGNSVAEKKRLEYFALITSLVTGVGIDSWLFILNIWVTPETLVGQWGYLILSIVMTGLGIAIYLQSEIAPNPMDRSMLIVSKLTGWTIGYSRAAINILLVITALLFSGAIGIGTVLNAVFSGMFITLFLPYANKIRKDSLNRLISKEIKLTKKE